jgi:hypothetical protein
MGKHSLTVVVLFACMLFGGTPIRAQPNDSLPQEQLDKLTGDVARDILDLISQVESVKSQINDAHNTLSSLSKESMTQELTDEVRTKAVLFIEQLATPLIAKLNQSPALQEFFQAKEDLEQLKKRVDSAAKTLKEARQLAKQEADSLRSTLDYYTVLLKSQDPVAFVKNQLSEAVLAPRDFEVAGKKLKLQFRPLDASKSVFAKETVLSATLFYEGGLSATIERITIAAGSSAPTMKIDWNSAKPNLDAKAAALGAITEAVKDLGLPFTIEDPQLSGEGRLTFRVLMSIPSFGFVGGGSIIGTAEINPGSGNKLRLLDDVQGSGSIAIPGTGIPVPGASALFIRAFELKYAKKNGRPVLTPVIIVSTAASDSEKVFALNINTELALPLTANKNVTFGGQVSVAEKLVGDFEIVLGGGRITGFISMPPKAGGGAFPASVMEAHFDFEISSESLEAHGLAKAFKAIESNFNLLISFTEGSAHFDSTTNVSLGLLHGTGTTVADIAKGFDSIDIRTAVAIDVDLVIDHAKAMVTTHVHWKKGEPEDITADIEANAIGMKAKFQLPLTQVSPAKVAEELRKNLKNGIQNIGRAAEKFVDHSDELLAKYDQSFRDRVFNEAKKRGLDKIKTGDDTVDQYLSNLSKAAKDLDKWNSDVLNTAREDAKEILRNPKKLYEANSAKALAFGLREMGQSSIRRLVDDLGDGITPDTVGALPGILREYIPSDLGDDVAKQIGEAVGDIVPGLEPSDIIILPRGPVLGIDDVDDELRKVVNAGNAAAVSKKVSDEARAASEKAQEAADKAAEPVKEEAKKAAQEAKKTADEAAKKAEDEAKRAEDELKKGAEKLKNSIPSPKKPKFLGQVSPRQPEDFQFVSFLQAVEKSPEEKAAELVAAIKQLELEESVRGSLSATLRQIELDDRAVVITMNAAGPIQSRFVFSYNFFNPTIVVNADGTVVIAVIVEATASKISASAAESTSITSSATITCQPFGESPDLGYKSVSIRVDPLDGVGVPDDQLRPEIKEFAKFLPTEAARSVVDVNAIVQSGLQRAMEKSLSGIAILGNREFVEKVIAVRNSTATPVTVSVTARHRTVARGGFEWQWVAAQSTGAVQRGVKLAPGETRTFRNDGGREADHLGEQSPLLSGAAIVLSADSESGERWEFADGIFIVDTNRALGGDRAYYGSDMQTFVFNLESTYAPPVKEVTLSGLETHIVHEGQVGQEFLLPFSDKLADDILSSIVIERVIKHPNSISKSEIDLNWQAVVGRDALQNGVKPGGLAVRVFRSDAAQQGTASVLRAQADDVRIRYSLNSRPWGAQYQIHPDLNAIVGVVTFENASGVDWIGAQVRLEAPRHPDASNDNAVCTEFSNVRLPRNHAMVRPQSTSPLPIELSEILVFDPLVHAKHPTLRSTLANKGLTTVFPGKGTVFLAGQPEFVVSVPEIAPGEQSEIPYPELPQEQICVTRAGTTVSELLEGHSIRHTCLKYVVLKRQLGLIVNHGKIFDSKKTSMHVRLPAEPGWQEVRNTVVFGGTVSEETVYVWQTRDATHQYQEIDLCHAPLRTLESLKLTEQDPFLVPLEQAVALRKAGRFDALQKLLAQPDLLVESLTPACDSFTEGMKLKFKVRIRNVGGGPARFKKGMSIASAPGFVAIRAESEDVSIPPSEVLDFDLVSVGFAEVGPSELVLSIDPDDEVSEWSNSNNRQQKPFSFVVKP